MPLEGGSPSLGYRTQQFIQTGQPVYNVKEGPYQAKGDGSADDFAAITAAIAQAHADGPGSGRIGNVVFFPPGLYTVSQTIIVPEGVTLQGCGRVTSIIQARVGGTFTNNAIVQLGNPPTETLTFGSRIIDMAIDCNSVANSIGIRSTNINELAAVINCEIYNYMAAGIQIRTSAAQNYTLRDLYLLLSASAGNGVAYGIDIDGGGSPFRGVDGCTVDSLGADTHIAAIRVNNTSGFELCRFHVENCTDGIVVGDTGSCGSFAIDGVTGSAPITSVVRITAAQSFRVNGCVILSGATNSIVDTPRSVTITDAQAATYEVGNGTNNPSVNLSDASGALSTFRALFAKDDLFVGAPGHNTGTSRIKHGSFTLAAGTKVVNDADVTANSRIFLMVQTPGGTPGWLQVSARSAGVSFTALSSSGTDTSVCAYLMIEP